MVSLFLNRQSTDQRKALIAKFYFINSGKPIQEERLFQYHFPEQLRENIRRFVRNLAALPLWVNKDLSATVFGRQAEQQLLADRV